MQQSWKPSGNITDKLLWWSLVYLAVVMPFQKPVVPVWPGIAVMIASWLFSGDLKNKFRRFLKNKSAVLFAALYLLYCIGFFYSENTNAALTDLLLKIPLLLFPLVFAGNSTPINKSFFLRSFLFSVLLSALFCLIRATYLTLTTEENYFFYTKLSWFFHVGHYAMYLVFASLIAIRFAFKMEMFSKKLMYSMFALSLIVMLFLLAARAQLVAFLFISFSGIVTYFILNKKWKTGIIISGLAVVICISAVCFLPGLKERTLAVKGQAEQFLSGDREHYNAISVRFMIWESGIEVIKKSFFTGVGTGDEKVELLEVAAEKNYSMIVEKNLNYHNQYMQTLAAIGLPGLLSLIGFMTVGFIYGIKKKEFLVPAFFALIAISFLTESMLERQAGVIFYSFFSALLIFADRQKNAENL